MSFLLERYAIFFLVPCWVLIFCSKLKIHSILALI